MSTTMQSIGCGDDSVQPPPPVASGQDGDSFISFPTPIGTEFDLTPSLSQKAYWEDPHAFLARLEERAMSLFESGYFAYPTDEPHCFSVVHHARRATAKDSEYFVRPVEGTCTCPFFTRQETGEYLPGAVGENLGEDGEQPYIVPCKHLRGLSLLVRKTRRWLYQTGQIRAFCALAIPWMRMLAHLRRERIRQEHGGHDFSKACTNFIYRGVREKRERRPATADHRASRRSLS